MVFKAKCSIESDLEIVEDNEFKSLEREFQTIFADLNFDDYVEADTNLSVKALEEFITAEECKENEIELEDVDTTEADEIEEEDTEEDKKN